MRLKPVQPIRTRAPGTPTARATQRPGVMSREPSGPRGSAGGTGAWPVVDMKVMVIPRSSGAEVAQHGEHATMVAVPGRQSEFGEDVVDVLLDRAAADHERVGDG